MAQYVLPWHGQVEEPSPPPARVPKIFSELALEALLAHCVFETVLDVGSGAGVHSKIFENNGKQVTSVDFGVSAYYQRTSDNREVVLGDYYECLFKERFDLVWASHVLEHQPNVNLFLKKVFQDLKEGGWFAVTVPPLKHQIVGGHVSLWNAGLLLYHLVLAGFDCSAASIKKYGYNISIVVQKRSIQKLPDLHYDTGDINRLSQYFPPGLRERFDGDIRELNWPPTQN
jgi:SAM-dependent methyltransferase